MPKIKDERIPLNNICHYSRLYWGWKWASENGTSEDVELVGDELYLPKGLSDEDKFICAAFVCQDRELGLTCKVLRDFFGWDKCHSMKIKKRISQINTVTLICEEGGYGGKGWEINPDIIKEIKSIGEKQNEKCCLCANVDKFNGTNSFVCPIEKIPLDVYRIQHGYCMFKKLDVENLYNNEWIKSY